MTSLKNNNNKNHAILDFLFYFRPPAKTDTICLNKKRDVTEAMKPNSKRKVLSFLV